MKLLILGDNLGGGGAILANAILSDLNKSKYSDLALFIWMSPRVVIPPSLKYVNVHPIGRLRFMPRWIQRAFIVRSITGLDAIFNLTNFPVGKLGSIFRSSSFKEFCLFHNAYFFHTPSHINSFSFFFLFREVFMRRLMLRFSMLFMDYKSTTIIVQSNFMKKLVGNFFHNLPVHVAQLHKPPTTHSGNNYSPDQILKRLKVKQYWIYPSSPEPHKEHNSLIDIFLEAKSRGFNPKIFVTIEPNHRYGREFLSSIKLKNLNENIVNLGILDPGAILSLYNECKGIVFLSKFESLGIPMLEARFHNIRLLCSKSNIADEILADYSHSFDLSSENGRSTFINLLCSPIQFEYRHAEAPSVSIVDAYFFDFYEH